MRSFWKNIILSLIVFDEGRCQSFKFKQKSELEPSKKSEPSSTLNAFFDYLLGHLSDNQFVRSIEESVENARQHKEWRREYMTLLMRDQENFRAGKAEGLAEGKAEGLAEGKAKGLAEGKVEGTVKGIILLGTEFGLSQEEILKKIVEQTGMDSERALEF